MCGRIPCDAATAGGEGILLVLDDRGKFAPQSPFSFFLFSTTLSIGTATIPQLGKRLGMSSGLLAPATSSHTLAGSFMGKKDNIVHYHGFWPYNFDIVTSLQLTSSAIILTL